jgi:nicotinamidase/pyrazinamidase
MAFALFVIDLQRDFVDRIPGGAEVADAVTQRLRANPGRYDLVIASRDWHDGHNDNGGHFPPAPPGSPHPWLTHCVAGTFGAEYAPEFDSARADLHVLKGQGRPDYSLFRGVSEDGERFPDTVRRLGIDSIEICGLATEFCVRAGAIDALEAGLAVTVLAKLSSGYSIEAQEDTYRELESLGAVIER